MTFNYFSFSSDTKSHLNRWKSDENGGWMNIECVVSSKTINSFWRYSWAVGITSALLMSLFHVSLLRLSSLFDILFNVYVQVKVHFMDLMCLKVLNKTLKNERRCVQRERNNVSKSILMLFSFHVIALSTKYKHRQT